MTWYDRRIQSDRVRGLSRRCEDCGRPMPATGNLFHARLSPASRWLIEYECVHCRQRSRIWTPDNDALVSAILAEEPGAQ